MEQLNQLSSMLQKLTDQQLMQEASHPSPNVPQFLVLSEVQRRKALRTAVPKPNDPTPVAQEMTGIAGTPQMSANPTPPGAGGIQGFAEGGQVQHFDNGGLTQTEILKRQSKDEHANDPSWLPSWLQDLGRLGTPSPEAAAAVEGGSYDPFRAATQLGSGIQAAPRSSTIPNDTRVAPPAQFVGPPNPPVNPAPVPQQPASPAQPIQQQADPMQQGVVSTPAADPWVQTAMYMESRGKRYASDGTLLRSPKGAGGEMQVMDATMKDPGLGVTPARDDSPDERARVGRDYLSALRKRYNSDPTMVYAAYNGGYGRVDKAMEKASAEGNPDGWLDKMPLESRKYAIKGANMLGSTALARRDQADSGFMSNLSKLLPEIPAMPDRVDKPAMKSVQDFLPDAENYVPDNTQGMLDRNEQRMVANASRKSDTLNMALINTGLGIMAGKSRYALQNIGEGGIMGMKNYQEQMSDVRKENTDLQNHQDLIMQAQQARKMGLYKTAADLMEKSNDQTMKGYAGEITQRGQERQDNTSMRSTNTKVLGDAYTLEGINRKNDTALQRAQVLADSKSGANDWKQDDASKKAANAAFKMQLSGFKPSLIGGVDPKVKNKEEQDHYNLALSRLSDKDYYYVTGNERGSAVGGIPGAALPPPGAVIRQLNSAAK